MPATTRTRSRLRASPTRSVTPRRARPPSTMRCAGPAHLRVDVSVGDTPAAAAGDAAVARCDLRQSEGDGRVRADECWHDLASRVLFFGETDDRSLMG